MTVERVLGRGVAWSSPFSRLVSVVHSNDLLHCCAEPVPEAVKAHSLLGQTGSELSVDVSASAVAQVAEIEGAVHCLQLVLPGVLVQVVRDLLRDAPQRGLRIVTQRV